MRLFLFLISLAGLGLFEVPVKASEHSADVGFTMIRDPSTPHDTQPRLEVIRVGIKDAAGNEMDDHRIRTDSPALLDPRRFQLKQNGQPVTFTPLLKNVVNGQVSAVFLVPQKSLKNAEGVTMEMTPGVSPGLVLLEGESIPSFGPLQLTAPTKDIEFLARNKAIQRKIAVLGGPDGPSASLKLAYGMDSLETAPLAGTVDPATDHSHDRFWRLQSTLDADLSYRPSHNQNYINSVNGEVDYVLAQFFQAKQLADVRGLFETGLASRLEADQVFDRVNVTVGWTNWLALNSPDLSRLAAALCLFGKPEANAAPILVFGYDYVTPVKNDLPGDNQGEDTGRNRLRGRFYWTLQLAHKANLLVVQDWDADFLIDAGGVYDFASGKFLPDVRLSLDLGPDSKDKTQPSLTLSFVNGKSTPTFRNYNALLAGFGLHF